MAEAAAAGSAAHEAVEAVTACATARGSGARGRGAAGSAAAHEAVEDARTSSSRSSRLWIRERTKYGLTFAIVMYKCYNQGPALGHAMLFTSSSNVTEAESDLIMK